MPLGVTAFSSTSEILTLQLLTAPRIQSCMHSQDDDPLPALNSNGTYIYIWVSFRENEKWRIYIKVTKMLHV